MSVLLFWMPIVISSVGVGAFVASCMYKSDYTTWRNHSDRDYMRGQRRLGTPGPMEPRYYWEFVILLPVLVVGAVALYLVHPLALFVAFVVVVLSGLFAYAEPLRWR